jgi:DNA-binding transcriptional regulator YdaS (Cro superfamily)
MELREYLSRLTPVDRENLAAACGTTLGHLKNVAHGYNGRRAAAGLAVELERHSGRAITCEELRPDVDWAFIRATAPPPKPRTRKRSRQ